MVILFSIVALGLFFAGAIAIVRYLRASFELLELVQSDERLWNELGRPQRQNMHDIEAGQTIQPALPWLQWVWHARTNGLDRRLAAKLQLTSTLLRDGLILFVSTLTAMLMLFAALA